MVVLLLVLSIGTDAGREPISLASDGTLASQEEIRGAKGWFKTGGAVGCKALQLVGVRREQRPETVTVRINDRSPFVRGELLTFPILLRAFSIL